MRWIGAAGVVVALALVAFVGLDSLGERSPLDRELPRREARPAPRVETPELERLRHENERLRAELETERRSRPAPAEAPGAEESAAETPDREPPRDEMEPRIDLLARAIESGDQAAAWGAGVGLATWAGQAPSRAIALLSRLARERDPQMIGALALVAAHAGPPGDPSFRRALLDLLSSDLPPANLHGMAIVLAQAVDRDPTVLDDVGPGEWAVVERMATSPEFEGNRRAAVRLLGRRAEEGPVGEVLVGLLAGAPEADVRRAALEGIRRVSSERSTRAVVSSLARDPDVEVRRDATLSLLYLNPRPEILPDVEAAFERELDWGVRAGMLTVMARLDPERTHQVLDRALSVEGDPRMEARLRVVRDLLAGGETDWVRLAVRSMEAIRRIEIEESAGSH